MKKYIDSNIFIYPVVADEKTETKSASAKRILLQIATRKLDGDAVTSCLTWDELVWVFTRFLGRKLALVEGKKFLEFPNLQLLGIDATTISRAQDLIEKYGINPRDSIHAACALENGIKEIISDDSDFDKVKELNRVGLGSIKS